MFDLEWHLRFGSLSLRFGRTPRHPVAVWSRIWENIRLAFQNLRFVFRVFKPLR